MSKMNLQDLKDLFSIAKVKGNSRISKHQAGKKGFKHSHNHSVKKSSGISSKAQERKDIAEMIAWSIEFHSAK